ncbi:helix-turn-helix transcriptional regulator [Streptomyces pseudovenezuelae]|uniref:Transcriptional regulator with XRE-family HTH domain n=1 Tax=Streptomyces pseudovenezuelae TaxID=67350 RepID=A0ABT6LXU9_9ACTN|nr:helix-turn-helix transcriptional regulator [Streptomyces pseudovenezuelae]MDH6221136.1 transcriptional regulator with XRE-family HTH domain [Streptomyces pseudovenezuelae]
MNHFGMTLRGWRERMSPQDSGLEAGGERRIPGLRREELARLAGVSVDYLVLLEQGRARNPSAQVVTALARALRLDPSERDHLFRCANLEPPSAGNVSRRIPMSVQRLVHRLGAVPAGVFAADWTIIGWNRMWTATVGDPRTYGWEADNLVAGMFQTRASRDRDPNAAWPVRTWRGSDSEVEDLVADLRVTAAAHPRDARLSSLVEGLLRREPAFARLWFNGTAGPWTGDRKTIEHPTLGAITIDVDVLMPAGTNLKVLTCTTAAETTDAEKMDALRAAWHLEGKGLDVSPEDCDPGCRLHHLSVEYGVNQQTLRTWVGAPFRAGGRDGRWAESPG